VANTQNNIAIVLKNQGKFDEALEMYEKALETTVRAVGPLHVDVAKTYNNMAIVERKLGNFQKALELYEKSLEIKIKSLGGDHASVALTEMNIGNVLDEMGDHENALLHLQKNMRPPFPTNTRDGGAGADHVSSFAVLQHKHELPMARVILPLRKT
jgi:tetratricopeptide (TPR) repeat protein